PDTALVVVNLVSNVTGVSNDVPAIGALLSRRGIPLLVDGAQGVGHIPVDVAAWGVDMLACPAHKGLHGLSGGFLLTNRSLAPLLYGGTGTASQSLRQPLGVDGWEAGTQDYAGICALGKGVEWTYAHLDRLIAQEDGLIDYLLDELSSIERVKVYGHGHGILSFALEGAPSTWVADQLDERDIAVRAGLHCAPLMHRYLGTTREGLVRVSVGWDTTTRDIDRLLAALTSLARQ
ncbi:MAG: aminotransferase class V-fold PLP-dependent enzyme, partial [Clostridia bacterium]|nr:aminotransferase class V-fold PLP-dependent enzyme [Clostridia bacterium]